MAEPLCQSPIKKLPLELLDQILIQLVIVDDRSLISGYKDSVISNQGSQLRATDALRKQSDLLNFRMVDNKFNQVYQLRFDSVAPILRLPSEILDNILAYLVHDSGRLIPIDHRASLSVESFQSEPPPISVEDSSGTSHFRLTCKRFAKLGVNRQFARVSIRFSKAGFERLQWVAKQPHLATEVKKFSYIVPIFYPQGHERFEELLNQTRTASVGLEEQYRQRQLEGGSQRGDRLRPTTNQLRSRLERSKNDEKQIDETMAKAEEQRQILKRGTDRECLLGALRAFTALQQIRLMKFEDRVDAGWAHYLRNNPALAAEFRPHEWTRACEHATTTLGQAYLLSNCPATRFSSRFMDPQTPLLLTHRSQTTISELGVRLICLELQFNDPSNLDEKMLQLSSLFQALFAAATNIQGLHIGFPKQRPVSIQLETVFHNVQWEKLRYIGFGAWRVSGDEIISLLRRHRKTLRSVRLRGVLLKEGSRWADVLKVLRLELKLKWISLRDVGYTSRVGEQPGWGVDFVPMVQGQPDSDSDGDSDWGDNGEWDEDGESSEETSDEHESSNSEVDNEGSIIVGNHTDDDAGHDPEDSADGSDGEDSDFEITAHDNSIRDQTMLQHSTPADPLNEDQALPHTFNTGSICYCHIGYGMLDLKDEGDEVPKKSWKMWQKWVIRRCSTHDT